MGQLKRRIEVDTATKIAMVKDYESGLSFRQVSIKYSLSAGPIERTFAEYNVTYRTQAEAVRKIAKLPRTQAQIEGTKSMSEKKLGSTRSRETKIRTALSRPKNLGYGERQLLQSLSHLEPNGQTPCEIYNLDITVKTTSIEVERSRVYLIDYKEGSFHRERLLTQLTHYEQVIFITFKDHDAFDGNLKQLTVMLEESILSPVRRVFELYCDRKDFEKFRDDQKKIRARPIEPIYSVLVRDRGEFLN